MTTATMTKNQVGTQVGTETTYDVIGKATLATMLGAGALVGVWGVVSFVGALVVAGSPLSLIQGFFTAVIGG